MAQVSPYLAIFVAILICYIYIIASAFFVHKKCNYIHETAVSILLGIVVGAIVAFRTNMFETNNYQVILRDVIMLILLPPMLFQDGYNIRKRKFFQNIMYINLYGILGTIANFLVLFAIFYTFNHFQLIRTINNQPLQLLTWQMLAMASCLCSIDTIVPEKIVNPQRYPKLFSIIFGESIMKDTITVTLFDAIINFSTKSANQSGSDPDFDASALGFLVLAFIQVFAGSILIGTFSALFTTFLFKNLRFLLDEKGVAQVALIVLVGYVSYILSQWASFSGVISMLFCGITLSHFNIYNLTSEGKLSAKIAVSTLAKVAQGLLFFLLGAFIFIIQVEEQSDQTVQYTFSWSLLIITIISLLIARLINIYLLTLIGYFIVGKQKWRLNKHEYLILVCSGMVKGAVPFAVILTMPSLNRVFSTSCVQNTVITMVFLTSLFFNSLMPKILRNQLNKIDEMVRTNQNHPSLYDSLLIQFHKKELEHQKDNQSKLDSNHTSRNESQITSKMVTKKQLQQMALHARLKSTTQKYWKRCQQGFLKPFLIFDYYNRKQQIKMEKIQMRKQQAQEFWKRFRHDNYLDPQNEENNIFIDVKLIESDHYSQDDEYRNKIIEQKQGQFVCYAKKQKSKTQNQLQVLNNKNQKSKTQAVIPVLNKKAFSNSEEPIESREQASEMQKQAINRKFEQEKGQEQIARSRVSSLHQSETGKKLLHNEF